MSHDHHHHPRPTSAVELRARALEAVLAERGLVRRMRSTPSSRLLRTDIGPQNGAKVVARAWVDEIYRAGCWATPTPRSRSLDLVASRATTWLWSPTPRGSTT